MSLLQDLTLGQYLPGDSFAHRLDPRVKLCGTMGLMIALVWVKDPRVFLMLLVLLLAGTWLTGLPSRALLKNLRAFQWLLLITFFANACFTPGQSVVVWNIQLPWVTDAGLFHGALFTLRMMVIMLIAALLTLTTAPLDVADGLESLLKPLKPIGVPAHELAMMMVIALRFIPTLVDEAERLRKAQMARGADFSGNPVRRARKLTALLIPLMVSAFRRADELAVAMEARCYRGGMGRTHYRELRLTTNDYVTIFCILSLTAAFILVSFR